MIEIDPVQVEKMAELHDSIADIAYIVGCSRDTLERRFREELERGKAKGRRKLRQLQWRAAEKGNVVMLIWLGKQYLGQKDKSDEEIEAEKEAAQGAIPTAETIAEAIRKARESK